MAKKLSTPAGQSTPAKKLSTPADKSQSAVWYKSKSFCLVVKAFHDEFARQPTEEMAIAKQVHECYITEIAKQLRSEGVISRCEFTGSSYEGVKINNDLEFDVMVILDGGQHLIASPVEHRPGYKKLKPNFPNPNISEDKKLAARQLEKLTCQDENGYISAAKTAAKFHGILQKCINKSEVMKGKVKLIDHGPATQMNIYRSEEDLRNNTTYFSVDIVPTFEVGPQKELYVAKPLKGECVATAWRRSFSVDEKNSLLTADTRNGCRKQVLRVLKAIRYRESGLKSLPTYYFKSVLFKEMKTTASWDSDKVGERLWNVFNRLVKELTAGKMPHHFSKKINILHGQQSTIAIANVRDRLRAICNSECEFYSVLKISK